MATNDALLLDGVIDDLLEQNASSDRGKFFELFALKQILKDWDLSTEEINAGWTDGRQDGGIDGFYVIVNGHCIRDISEFSWPKSSVDIVLHIVTCKHAETFTQAALDAMVASLTELLDLSIDDRNLRGAYSKAILVCRARLLVAYRRLAPRLATFKVVISYASRGNTAGGIGDEVAARSEQIVSLVRGCFNGVDVRFDFVGSTELIDLYRKRPRFSLDLPYVSSLSSPGSSYVLLVRLSDYFSFCSDENGKLRRYLFESNVRDFMGLNRVNDDIAQTLADVKAPDFWWLNNGVTILATSAWSTSSTLHMENVQIVNGLQTTESIYRHFSQKNQFAEDACAASYASQSSVLVKVITSSDEEARDRIIRATNNQTSVEQISLHATEKVQRDIEEALGRVGLHYERRKNYYLNLGVSPATIVTPMYLAAGILALGRRRQPWLAVALKQRHLNDAAVYGDIFSERVSLQLWAPIAFVLRVTDQVLEEVRPRGASEGLLKKNRYTLALLSVARKFGTFNYSEANLVSLFNDAAFIDVVREVLAAVPQAGSGSGRKKSKVVAACQELTTVFAVAGLERIARGRYLTDRSGNMQRQSKSKVEVSEHIISKVLQALPPQPWKPGQQFHVASAVGCSVDEYFAAVEKLIADGHVLRQVDGVLYDRDGSVHSYDRERVVVGEFGELILK
ncbi:AIPR family protein [Stenotrophomonas maltophilia]|uniref:AIPR family protein n=1 Tax=Stenotrophomonas maltophilia TaxID=40324 RepID=UPI003BF82ED5